MPAPWPETLEESEAKRPRVSALPARGLECRRSIESAGGLSWSSADLALAATLLETPNARFPSVAFKSVEEKRRVFTLVYDVLRYKSILNQALSDLYFFIRHPHLKDRCHLVWLLFLDLYKRDFTLRDALDPEVESAFTQHGLHEIDEVLWQLRVKLAATVSRLRIKSGAHSLSNLLPRHLQVMRSATDETVITGWINIFKTNLREVCQYLENSGLAQLSRDQDILQPFTFKTDHLLPRFLHIMPGLREDLIESSLVYDHLFVMQERTFCLGPAMMAQLLKDYALSGKVAQTHVNSPTTMGYFANLLINNDKIETLLVFGTGYRKDACEEYLRELGVKNTQVYAESFAGLSPENKVLDNVIAVLVTPPNTNSSVVDPVDLAVTRGGDMQILQELTDEDFSSTPSGEHINKFLLEQRDTLRRAMSKPQIQFVVYETHSRFTCENEEMVGTLVSDLNNYAAEVHLEEMRRAQGETQDRERSQVEASESEVPVVRVEEDLTLPMPTPVQTLVIPPSDLFELAELPDLCPNFENCLDLAAEGTYIAVIKRKEITRLDAKYMIQMAEARGLFGRPEGTPKTKTTGQTARAKAALAALQARAESMSDKGKAKVKVEMDRIAAPTRASMMRDVRPPSTRDCPRFAHHLAHDGTPMYMRRLPKEHRTILTVEEEEELIRRLYNFPKVNVFPTRLYEDLPPLKFWNSPASVVESYLQRKLFQKRLQLAYEFNQSKGLSNENVTPKQLSRAMIQLTDDLHYFSYIANQQKLSQGMIAEVKTVKDYKENKIMWERVRPEVIVTPEQDAEPEIEQHFKSVGYHERLLKKIKTKYFDYKNYYKLQNIKIDDKKALALTIGLPATSAEISQPISEPSISFYSNDEANDEPNIMGKENIITPESEPIQKPSDINKHTVAHKSRLKKPELQSIYSLKRPINYDQNFQYVSAVKDKQDIELPAWLKTSLAEESLYSKRETITSVRDSLLLTQGRMSKGSYPWTYRSNLPSRGSIVSHRNSYILLLNKQLGKQKTMDSTGGAVPENFTEPKKSDVTSTNFPSAVERTGTLVEHHDSIELTFGRLASKEKDDDSVICDICDNAEEAPVRFKCISCQSKSTLGKTPDLSVSLNTSSFSSHRDSTEIPWRKRPRRENTKSVACQATEMKIPSSKLTGAEDNPPVLLK